MVTIQNLKQSINRNVEAIMPQDDQKEAFKNALESYFNKIKANEHESEEFQKGVFKDFLEEIIPDKQIKTKGKIDLAIYNGKSTDSNVGVIVEYKKLDNTAEMMSLDNLNAKGFRELVAYYLRERVIKKTSKLKKVL